MIVRDKFQIGRVALLRGLDFGRRGSAALPLFAAIIFFAVDAMAQTTNGLSDAEIQGRRLAQQLLEQEPVTDFVQKGVLSIRAGKGKRSEVPFQIQTMVKGPAWQVDYETICPSNRMRLIVLHEPDRPNGYYLWEGFEGSGAETDRKPTTLNGVEIMTPFAGSDFWVADLGLEFFHWPEQKVLKKEIKRSRGCTVLESTNPNPSTNDYSRVVSWIDGETLGMVQAEAYDTKGRLLKEFSPKSFKKVNGQWELQEMEIRNVQTGSRTRLDFDVKPE
jgi:hypothetical protein